MLPRLVLLLLAPAATLRVPPVRMDSSWRPKTIDPLGQAFGTPKQRELSHVLWLDMRDAEVTFAQMALVKLFYAVRKIVDEAGRALPRGAAVQGLLYSEDNFDRADTIGSETVPVYLQTASGAFVNATVRDEIVPVPAELRAPLCHGDLCDAEEQLGAMGEGCVTAIALPADPMLWAAALTGLDPEKLALVEGNEGA